MTESLSTYYDELGPAFQSMMNMYDVARRKRLIFNQLMHQVNLSGALVLEVGCGTGCFTEELVKRGAVVTALDIGAGLVSSVSSRLGCSGVVGDACQLPFPDASFDFVVSSECIEHTPEPEKALAEMCRVCKPGGEVCVTSPNKLWYPVLWLAMKTRMRKFAGMENWLWPKEASRTLQRGGMSILKRSGCHAWPFQLGFTRKILACLDDHAAWLLHPVMINYGIRAKKL